ncbi:MAG TPA: hypothetical protein VL295_04655 [Gemmatimonadales bacterium]|jgi:hypothetical protein|nr:hypothetical protein [Gemmatimonadales bacterium]
MDDPSDEEVIAIYARRAFWFRIIFLGCALFALLDTAAVSAGLLDNRGAGLYIMIGCGVGFVAGYEWFRRCPRCGYQLGRAMNVVRALRICPECDARLTPDDD